MSPKKQRVGKRETMSSKKRKGSGRGGKGGDGMGANAKKGKVHEQYEISQNGAAAASVGEEVRAKSAVPLTKVEPKGTTTARGAGLSNTSMKFHPTVADIMKDPLIVLAQDLWAPGKERGPYQEDVVVRIYEEDLGKSTSQGTRGRIGVLDYSCYLENYLWPYWGGQKCKSHALSIVLLTNEKFARGGYDCDPWVGSDEEEDTTESKKGKKSSATLPRDRFSSLLDVLVDLYLEGKLTMDEKGALVWFIVNAFQSLEKPVIRSAVLPLCSLALWGELTVSRREQLFLQYPLLGKAYNILNNKKQGNGIRRPNLSSFLPCIANEVAAITEGMVKPDSSSAFFVARCIELFIDLLSQVPIRRFLRTVLLYMCFLERLELSALNGEECGGGGVLFRTQVKHLGAILRFEVDGQSGKSLSSAAAAASHHERVHHAQMVAFLELRDVMPNFPLVSTSVAGKEEHLRSEFERLDETNIVLFAAKLGLVDGGSTGLELAKRAILNNLAERPSPLHQVNSLALYPDEAELWRKGGGGSEGILLSINDRTSHWGQPLALPKLSLQYLTLRDYLLRNFTLYRLESSCAIRDDVEDAIKRLGPPAWPMNVESTTTMMIDNNGEGGGMMMLPKFAGWARYGLPVKTSQVITVRSPHIGQVIPAEVLGEVTIDVGKFTGPVRAEWDDLKEHDVVFLVKFAKPEENAVSSTGSEDMTKTFKEEKGIEFVRGAEIVTVEDASKRGGDRRDNNPMQQLNKPLVGSHRRLRLRLDPAQYREDVAAAISVYDSFHVLVRRTPQENNFRGVLESVRDVMNDDAAAGDEDVAVIPTWLHDVLLGYGDPSLACPKEGEGETLDFADTFLDSQHVRDAFSAEYKVKFDADSKEDPSPPYRVTFPGPGNKSKGVVTVAPYPDPPRATAGLASPPCRNTIRFTPTQVRAIRRAMRPGLTLIVGPPGTGKTDVATQVISNLYRAYPKERILVVAHSNGALNDLFDKTFDRDVDTRHLLRLGTGERDLAAAGDFSKLGRVNHALERRLILLEEVKQLSISLSSASPNQYGDPGSSCETAGLFFETQVEPKIARFRDATTNMGDDKNVGHIFPFSAHFVGNGPWQADQDITIHMANQANMYLIRMFEELRDYKAFEVLRTHSARAEYLFTTQARVVALTCTHASLQRRKLLEAEIAYDTVIMEESAQMLEVETLIPLLLQRGGRLKRVCLIGDHRQLPPVVKCLSLKVYSNLEQSMFSRFVRLGVPTVQLDMQGRARPSLAALYRWRYDGLQDLPLVLEPGIFSRENAGFAHVCQAVNVGDFNGIGEMAPTPHFFQNLGEAEYVVAVYQYMRLLGYPSNRIAILTTYKGQKALLQDVIGQRCANNPLFGLPHIIETVDSYQGKESDYVLLSLVRTKAVGHIRDARRLIVALSRSRLGLYVFCRRALFENCFELLPAFNRLLQRPSILQLILNEPFPTSRDETGESDAGTYEVQNVVQMGQIVYGMANLAKSAHVYTSGGEPAISQQKMALPAPAAKESNPGVGEVSHVAKGEGDDEDASQVLTTATANEKSDMADSDKN